MRNGKEWSRRAALSAALAVPASAVPGLAARAQVAQAPIAPTPTAPTPGAGGNWPSGPVRIVVPFPPGGSTDAVARLASPGLQHALGVPIVIENRSGAVGSIGADAVAKARPDGQTWLLTFDSHAVMPALLARMPFDLKRDLDPVTLIGGAPYVVACRPDKPFRNLADVVAAARAKPDGVTYASSGVGTIGHLLLMRLDQLAGARVQHMPYRGGGPAVSDAVAGHVDLVIGTAALIAPQLAGGTLRAVCQFGPERLPALAEVPTAAEQGFPQLEAIGWWGVFAPARTPPAIEARFHQALSAALREERVAKQIVEGQQAKLILGDGAEMARFLDAQIEVWGKVVRDNNIRAD